MVLLKGFVRACTQVVFVCVHGMRVCGGGGGNCVCMGMWGGGAHTTAMYLLCLFIFSL